MEVSNYIPKRLTKVYLATPYTHKSKRVMASRYNLVNHAAALLMNDPYRFAIFSPITHCHEIAKDHELPTTWEFWRDYDLLFIDWSEEMWVFMQSGWENSKGVSAEIEYAREIKKPIIYFTITPDDMIKIKK